EDIMVQLIKSGKKIIAFVPNDGYLNFIEENDDVLVAGFGREVIRNHGKMAFPDITQEGIPGQATKSRRWLHFRPPCLLLVTAPDLSVYEDNSQIRKTLSESLARSPRLNFKRRDLRTFSLRLTLGEKQPAFPDTTL
ncbi:hypothetical protein A6R68_07219, partial [Neotoma lepida]